MNFSLNKLLSYSVFRLWLTYRTLWHIFFRNTLASFFPAIFPFYPNFLINFNLPHSTVKQYVIIYIMLCCWLVERETNVSHEGRRGQWEEGRRAAEAHFFKQFHSVFCLDHHSVSFLLQKKSCTCCKCLPALKETPSLGDTSPRAEGTHRIHASLTLGFSLGFYQMEN